MRGDVVLGYRQDELEGVKIINQDMYTLEKVATTKIERDFIENERRFLSVLYGTGFAPAIYPNRDEEYFKNKQEFIESENVTDEVEFYRNCVRLLLALRKHKIRHGDLTRLNIKTRNNTPVAIDFLQSKFYDESGPDKRPEGDAYHLWNSALYFTKDTTRRMRRWLAMRDHIDGSIVDLGCGQGDFCAFAWADKGVKVHGVDINADEISKAWQLWHEPNDRRNSPTFGMKNIVKDNMHIAAENVFLLSVFGHLVKEYGRAMIDEMINEIFLSQHVKRLFFETHLNGDGPGGFENDREVFDYLNTYGEVTWLAQIPVHGRNRARSLWMVEK